jgi:hypothetical protein
MTPREVNELAVALMERHGLHGWTVRLDRAKSRRGCCYFVTRRITLSVHLLPLGQAEVESTILHEIAHALVGPTHHHDAIWHAKARELGHSGGRCGAPMGVPHAWASTCPDCNRTARRHRLTERVKRGACCPCRPWSADRVLTWKKV